MLHESILIKILEYLFSFVYFMFMSIQLLILKQPTKQVKENAFEIAEI